MDKYKQQYVEARKSLTGNYAKGFLKKFKNNYYYYAYDYNYNTIHVYPKARSEKDVENDPFNTFETVEYDSANTILQVDSRTEFEVHM